MHDLGNWAQERYRIAGPPVDETAPQPDDDGDDADH